MRISSQAVDSYVALEEIMYEQSITLFCASKVPADAVGASLVLERSPEMANAHNPITGRKQTPLCTHPKPILFPGFDHTCPGRVGNKEGEK